MLRVWRLNTSRRRFRFAEKGFRVQMGGPLMENAAQTLKEAEEKTFNLTGHYAVVGLDGFVDKIVTPIDQRHGMGENFDPIETIAELGRDTLV